MLAHCPDLLLQTFSTKLLLFPSLEDAPSLMSSHTMQKQWLPVECPLFTSVTGFKPIYISAVCFIKPNIEVACYKRLKVLESLVTLLLQLHSFFLILPIPVQRWPVSYLYFLWANNNSCCI